MIQQNQLIDIYNHFRLLTSESWTSQNRWSTIGFYPDVADAGGFATTTSIYVSPSSYVIYTKKILVMFWITT
jgi:hypothetical protein